MPELKKPKFNIGLYISTLTIIIALIIVFFIMYKYSIEGEAIPPFKISKMIVVSSAKTENIEKTEDTYSAKVIQNNDIRISIEKNPEYKKEAIIRKVTINNIQINKNQNIGNVEIYRPSRGNKLYEYDEKYKLNNKVEYLGAQETYTKNENLEISNQGGIIDFSIILNNLGIIEYTENEQIKIDGSLIDKLGIKQEQLSFQVKFDLIIELESDVKLKTKMILELPTGNIIKNGIETLEQENMKTVFKRI